MASSPLASPPRVFINASVVFAASLSAVGFARDLIMAAHVGQGELLASPFVVEETRRNLTRKALHALPFFETFLSAGITHVIEPSEELVRRDATVVILKNAPTVAGAIEAQAPYLASYDRRHLLHQAAVTETHFGIVVATPESILARL